MCTFDEQLATGLPAESALRQAMAAMSATNLPMSPQTLFVGARGSGEAGPGTKAWKPTASDPFGLGSTVNILYERLAKDIDSRRTVQAASVSYGADNVRTLTHDYPKYFRDLSTGVGWVLGYLKTLAAVCPDQRIVLVGYSQGAMVMHRVLHNLGTSGAGKQILKRVVSAVLVGDEPAEMGDPHPAPGALRFGHMPTRQCPASWTGTSIREESA